ncbi:hypothetical protein P3X46_011687 [Hevea brasiliensis]|uniref:Angiotensin-converting enzyme 2 n=1 Tax=Hevea brasiliensis TaxID=3981 RepID=A0ABQ9M9R1_HEVBR|nr:uncharacterized protein LOC110673688 [Hevea brasiliensis]KAJ9176368.1 hypothetical protein P3X46_011687 [Hevea brasiliensis]
MYYTHHQHLLPCLHCHPHSYIRMVHHLIERCLLLHMSRDQCIKALAEHANIRPLVTLTVWRELQKENKDFFHAYFRSTSFRPFPNRCTQRVSRLARRKQWNWSK